VTAGAAASRYARALFDVVLKEGGDAQVEKVQGEIQEFADLFANEALAHVLRNPAIPVSKKKALAGALVERAGQVTPPLAKLIVILAEKDRLTLLPGIARAYVDRVMDHLKIVRGQVTTAIPLAPETARAGAGAGDGPQGGARGPCRLVDHRRRRDAPRQHRLRRQYHDAIAEDETVLD
jgi:F-type H+-transporting ATPase subunit delta